ncbi:monocarboxylate transporter 9 isoform X2 [Patella vulgata]|uniref:monocarboxylate transporter 9 isoform X2 n=1 Tax=Patella vulgata TaxID=6465 RepID=UPI00217F528C|nr:monocarboxylate transporter 9 isoform X2 [Patella vulgata]
MKEDKKTMTKTEPWAWVVLAASICALFFNTALNFTVGVLHIAFLERFPDVDVSTISWLGALFSCMFALAGIIASNVISVFNSRTCVMLSGVVTLVGFTLSRFVTDIKYLFITYSFIAGSGQALCFAGTLVSLGYHFMDKTSMATGIAVGGCGLSSFIFPPFTQYLIDTYGLDGTFLMLGALGFQSSVFGALMKPTKYELRLKAVSCRSRQRTLETEKVSTVWQDRFNFFQSVPYWLFLVSSTSFSMAVSTVYLFMPEYFKLLGSTSQEAAFLLSIAGVTGTISRVLLGILASSVGVSIIFGGMFGIIGVVTFFIKFMSSLGGKISYTAFLGFYTGACWSLQYTLLVEINGLNNISTAYGVLMFCSGVGYLFGPPVAGVCFVIASVTGLLINVTTKKHNILEVKESEIGETDQKYFESNEKEAFFGINTETSVILEVGDDILND